MMMVLDEEKVSDL
jgi:hypothetical protein